MRVNIEKAFGIVVERGESLKYALRYYLDINLKVLEVLFLLHNRCMQKNEDRVRKSIIERISEGQSNRNDW